MCPLCGAGIRNWHTLMFDPTRLYRPSELSTIASTRTLRSWRQAGEGPPYITVGGRIRYLGQDLNDWLEQQKVRPEQTDSDDATTHNNA